MRTPTRDAYAWHAAALAGRRPSMFPDEPQAGWFKRKLNKKGAFVPCRIWIFSEVDAAGELVTDEEFFCEVDGSPRDAYDEWPWLCARPISEDEFKYMTAVAQWAKREAITEPQANPRAAINWLTVKPPAFAAKKDANS